MSVLGRVVVPASAAAAALARLPFVSRAAAPDEAGFLLVGGQWRTGGTSLYGDYWVDRPPLLITLFRVAAELGGLVPLRLIGCLATVAVVLGSAHIARTLSGSQAARWSAVVAAASCVSPLMGGLEVDGELLAAPFVVVGISAVLRAVREHRGGRALLASGLAGASTVAALLVKQNMADVAVFAVVTVLVGWRRGDVPTSRLRHIASSYALGAAVALTAAAGWTVLHGTALPAVFDAMYPFRLEAGRVIATSSHQHAAARLWLLVISWVVSGGAVITAAVTWALISRRLRGPAAWGLAATIVFDVVSVALGGSYWHHYLIEMVVPVAVVSGLLVAPGSIPRQPAIKAVLVGVVVVAAVAWGGLLPGSRSSQASTVGQAVGRAAHRGDTIITAHGNADITEASGLRSPYPYLWSLPARTLDPRLTNLDHILAGPHPATWFVTSSSLTSFGSVNETTERLLTTRYHRVADLDGRTVYLRNGIDRPAPQLPGSSERGSAPARAAVRPSQEKS